MMILAHKRLISSSGKTSKVRNKVVQEVRFEHTNR